MDPKTANEHANAHSHEKWTQKDPRMDQKDPPMPSKRRKFTRKMGPKMETHDAANEPKNPDCIRKLVCKYRFKRKLVCKISTQMHSNTNEYANTDCALGVVFLQVHMDSHDEWTHLSHVYPFSRFSQESTEVWRWRMEVRATPCSYPETGQATALVSCVHLNYRRTNTHVHMSVAPNYWRT